MKQRSVRFWLPVLGVVVSLSAWAGCKAGPEGGKASQSAGSPSMGAPAEARLAPEMRPTSRARPAGMAQPADMARPTLERVYPERLVEGEYSDGQLFDHLQQRYRREAKALKERLERLKRSIARGRRNPGSADGKYLKARKRALARAEALAKRASKWLVERRPPLPGPPLDCQRLLPESKRAKGRRAKGRRAKAETEAEIKAWRDAVGKGVIKLGPGRKEIRPDLLRRLKARPGLACKDATIVPAKRLGKPIGFRLLKVHPQSLFYALRFFSGDVITSLNGHAIASEAALRKALARLAEARRLDVGVLTYGKRWVVKYPIK